MARPRWWMHCSGRWEFGANETVGELIIDTNAQERERGITIHAKNIAIKYRAPRSTWSTPPATPISAVKSNAYSTWPTALAAGGCLEGPMPQTTFVSSKALSWAPANRGHQQDRPARRRAPPGARRGAGAVHRSGGDPRAARLRRSFIPPAAPAPPRAELDRAGHRPQAAVPGDPGPRPRRRRAIPTDPFQMLRLHPRLLQLPGADRHRADRAGPGQGGRPGGPAAAG